MIIGVGLREIVEHSNRREIFIRKAFSPLLSVRSGYETIQYKASAGYSIKCGAAAEKTIANAAKARTLC